MTTSVPALYSSDNAATLFSWLGSFWTSMCEDSELVRRVQIGNGILTARLYREFLDTTNCSSRYDCPVSYNDLVMPFELLKSARNTSKASSIQLGDIFTPTIGKQTEDPFIPGSYPTIGGQLSFSTITVYDLADKISDIKVITDSIIEPTVILLRDVNFFVRDNAIFFLNSDPFNKSAKSKVIYNQDGTIDYSIMLFAFNTLIDRDYIYNHVGYVVGLTMPTSKEYKLSANNLWDVYNFGPTMQKVTYYIGAILDEPVIKNETETVVAIIENTNYRQVATDTNIYTIPSNATLRSDVVVNAKLNRGAFLTNSVKFYDKVDYSRSVSGTNDAALFQLDVPALYIPTYLFRTTLSHGITVNNELTDIIHAGFDSHSNPLFTFKLLGNEEDTTAFWNDVHSYCDSQSIDMRTLLSDYLDDSYINMAGAICGRLYPLKFFIYNFFQAGLCIVAVDTSKLTSFGAAHVSELYKLQKLLPAHTLLIVINQHTVNLDNYNMDSSIEESYNKLVAKYTMDAGHYSSFASKRALTYKDSGLHLKWVPACA